MTDAHVSRPRAKLRRAAHTSAVAGLVLLLIAGCAGPGPRPVEHRIPVVADPAASAAAGGELAAAERLGPTDASTQIDFSLVLRQPGEAEFDRYLAALYDPSAPEYRQFLTSSQIGERYGLSDAALAEVHAWIAASGLELTSSPAQRTSLGVRGTAGMIHELFAVSLSDFRDDLTGQRFHAPVGEPTIPDAIASAVEGIARLSNRPVSAITRPLPGRPLEIPPPGLEPSILAAAYHIQPLYDRGIFGEGQTIAIVSFDTFLESDIETFDAEYGVTGPPVEIVPVAGGVAEPGPMAGEVTLDIQVVRAVAPQAQILDFEAPPTVGFADMIEAVLEDGRADIITISYGGCLEYWLEAGLRPDVERDQDAFQAAVAAGVTIFVSSGDTGAYMCSMFDRTDHRLSVAWPSSSSYVVSVGGTNLSVREDGTYLDEAGWEDYLIAHGGGGGVSPLEERPEWQQGVGVENEHSTGQRQLPDVAASGDSNSGFPVYFTEPDTGEAGWGQVGGTSASSPFWAASMLLIRELAEREGVGPLGYVNPMLYELAASHPPNTIFHDVTRGGNLFHDATPGWDYATGLGSPDVALLARAIVEYLQQAQEPPS